jgi:Na+/proline symporter
MSSGFSPIDVSILVVYLAASVGLGLYHARRQRSLEDYFLAERSAPWWAAGISVIASDTSAISYMGEPAYIFKEDLQRALAFVLTFPLMMVLVAWLFVPFLARLRLYTIYEYLERRFGVVPRSLASLLFLLLRGGHIAVAIYAQALALTLITGLDTAPAVLLCGAVVTLYTVFGGMKAVIWTDVLQFSSPPGASSPSWPPSWSPSTATSPPSGIAVPPRGARGWRPSIRTPPSR